MKDKPYHHGDLRAALIAAAEEEITAYGVEAFSLRAAARRAGVSHAAPAHHFGDTGGLLTALATEGYRQFLAMQAARAAAAGTDPKARLLATGLGYIDFATARPALFRLIFGSDRPDHADIHLSQAANAAFDHLIDTVAATGGTKTDALAVWAMTHGLADLVVSGRLKSVTSLPTAEREAALTGMMARAMG
jgi:AcrR family transcriptional regulator